MRRRVQQLELALDGTRRGGPRPGAGRKRVATRPCVPHRVRPAHVGRHPVHVTLRARREVGFLRTQLVVQRIARVLRDASRDRKGAPSPFRVVHYSVQADHVHLLVEARDTAVMTSRMTGLVTWVARRVNAVLRRSGRFWADRYHRRDLRTPREVRNALVYVLANHRKHVLERTGRDPVGIDAFSSAVFLERGWDPRAGPWLERAMRGAVRVEGGPPVARPRTWLAREGWRRHGLLRIDDVPSITATSLRRPPATSPSL